MEGIVIREYDVSDAEQLFLILSSNDWEYHSGTKITRVRFEEQLKNNYYDRVGVKTFVVEKLKTIIGFVRLFDLGDDFDSDETPLFDIRIEKENRQKGVGTFVVNHIVEYVFLNYPNKTRIEATTRMDNKAMRKVLTNCNFSKEAHYRNAWNCNSGKKYDAIGYGILSRDWDTGVITKVKWDQ